MKILNTLIFVLVVGILGFAIAQEEGKYHVSRISEIYLDFLRFYYGDNLGVMISSGETVMKKYCDKNGGPSAHGTAFAALLSFANSSQSIINETLHNASLWFTEPITPQDEFDNICRTTRTLNILVKPALDSVEPCMEPEPRQYLHKLREISVPLLEYICENRAARLTLFYDAGGFGCMMRNRDSGADMKNCIDTHRFVTINSTDRNVADVHQTQWNVPSIGGSLADCTKLDGFQPCFVKLFEECAENGSTLSKLVNSLLNIVKQESGCEALLKAQSSPATRQQEGANSEST